MARYAPERQVNMKGTKTLWLEAQAQYLREKACRLSEEAACLEAAAQKLGVLEQVSRKTRGVEAWARNQVSRERVRLLYETSKEGMDAMASASRKYYDTARELFREIETLALRKNTPELQSLPQKAEELCVGVMHMHTEVDMMVGEASRMVSHLWGMCPCEDPRVVQACIEKWQAAARKYDQAAREACSKLATLHAEAKAE